MSLGFHISVEEPDCAPVGTRRRCAGLARVFGLAAAVSVTILFDSILRISFREDFQCGIGFLVSFLWFSVRPSMAWRLISTPVKLKPCLGNVMLFSSCFKWLPLYGVSCMLYLFLCSPCFFDMLRNGHLSRSLFPLCCLS